MQMHRNPKPTYELCNIYNAILKIICIRRIDYSNISSIK